MHKEIYYIKLLEAVSLSGEMLNGVSALKTAIIKCKKRKKRKGTMFVMYIT